ncbi:DNA polymerase III subunit delta' [Orbaceae bacterium ESL0727]|nr:DNA polymerase III subunit delta' [Orbaceae bacterium ESL0727]
MQLTDYPWLVTPYQQLVAPILQQRAHHAFLLNYVPGSGEDAFITQFAKRLLCQQATGSEPCQKCHSCQLFAVDNHPDYYQVSCEKNKHAIGIDQIRSMTSKIYEKSQQGGNKVIWIKQAALMTEAAANALLKTVEEPPTNTYFILSDDHNHTLLPTIHSRCFGYFLPIPALDVSVAWLKERYPHYNDNELASALLLNENAPLAALALLAVDKWQQRKQFCATLLAILPNNDYWSLAKTIDAEQFIERINWFCSLLSDALKAKQKAGRFIINRDEVPLVRLLARQQMSQIIQLYDLWCDARDKLFTVTGLNKELMIYNVLAQSELVK